ncbi:hypothetical protein DDD_1208 [Nonlabens dokdonensis DSW-6]|uniref:Uncharacterized protein n=1 Tax=Nonlabens dokdonensis (strain DSM 17205 / KCTC 12402 / DSW-6) TaxID=592029 RepID=L7W433_NONDD|nr:hypothetical protein DDD_1208 [Nonlabens dokdonensis DSW-6]
MSTWRYTRVSKRKLNHYHKGGNLFRFRESGNFIHFKQVKHPDFSN